MSDNLLMLLEMIEEEIARSVQIQAPPTQDGEEIGYMKSCLLYTSPSPRDATLSRMPSSA